MHDFMEKFRYLYPTVEIMASHLMQRYPHVNQQSRNDKNFIRNLIISKKILSWLILSSLLISCMKVGPNFSQPVMKVPAQWQNTQGQTRNDPQNYQYWWKTFNDVTLNNLINMAYAQNLNLQIAASRIVEARAQLGFVKGNQFPQHQQINTEIAYNNLSKNLPNTDNFAFGTFELGFDAIWEADIWGKYRRGIESANANLEASSLSYDNVLVSLTAEVAANYIELRTLQQRWLLAKKNSELQANSLKITETLLRNGLGTELDKQQASALLNNTQATQSGFVAQIRQRQNALSVLLAKPPSELNYLLNNELDIPKASQTILVGIPADTIRRRPDIRREELKAAAQSAMIGVAQAELYPRFSLQGNLGLASSSANGVDVFDVLSTQAIAGKLGPTVTWPILNYGRLQNNVRIQEAKYEQLLLGYKNSVLLALREVEDALIGWHQAYQQVGELQQSVNASQRAVDIALLQYQNGLEDFTRVLNSEQLLVHQQDRLATTQGDTAIQIIALYKALGGGWKVTH